LATNQKNLIHEFLRRRMHMVFITFAMTLWGAIEFTSFVVNRYHFSEQWIDIVFFAGIAFTPSVLLVGWNHGAPGKDQWRVSEKYGIPVNIALVLAIFSNIDIESPLQHAEQNIVIQVQEPLEEVNLLDVRGYFYALNNTTGNPEFDDLSLTLPVLISEYYQQVETINIHTLLEQPHSRRYKAVTKAGFDYSQPINRSLALSLAKQFNESFFIDGSIEKELDGSFSVNISLHQLLPKSIVRFSYPYQGLEQVAQQLVTDINSRLTHSRPKHDIFHTVVDGIFDIKTTSLDLYIESRKALFNNAESQQVLTLLDDAFNADPACLPCAREYVFSTFSLHKQDLYQKGLQRISQLEYKIPHFMQHYFKALRHLSQANYDGAAIVFSDWVERYPKNRFALTQSSQFFRNNGKLLKAKELYGRLLNLYPEQSEYLQILGNLQMMIGELDAANDSFNRFHELHPEDINIKRYMAFLQHRKGNFELAIQYMREYIALMPEDVQGYIGLAQLQFYFGEGSSALETIGNGLRAATGIYEQISLLNNQSWIFHELGRYQEAADIVLQAMELRQTVEPKLSAIRSTAFSKVEYFVNAGRVAQLQQIIDDIEAESDVSAGYIFEGVRYQIAAYQNDFSKAKLHFEKFTEIAKQYFPDASAERLIPIEVLLPLQNKHHEYIQYLKEARQKSIEQSGLTPARSLLFALGGAESYLAADLYQEFIDLIEPDLYLYPYQPDLNYYLAQAYAKTGRVEDAVEALRKALKMWEDADADAEMPKATRLLHQELTSAND